MKNSFCSVLLAALIITTSLFCIPGSSYPQGKVIEFAYSSFYPPPPYGISVSTEAWAREIEKRSKGRVRITIYQNGTLTSAENCYEGVGKGLSDIGQSAFAYTRGRFPVMESIDLPGYLQLNGIITTRVANDVYNRFKPKELSDTHVLFLHETPPSGYCTVKRQLKKLEDFRGLRMRATGAMARGVEALGGSPAAMPKGDEYDSLRKGAVDGTVTCVTGLEGYRTAEVTKYFAYVPGAAYATGKFVVMNLKKWNSLPPDIKNIFTEVSEEWIEYTGKTWNKMDETGYKFGKAKGVIFTSLKGDEGARWQKALKPVLDEYVKKTEARGLPGKEILQYKQELIEKYDKVFSQPKFLDGFVTR